MDNRPYTTLFMLSSIDGKISTGSTDRLDVDKDFPHIEGLREGLQQYYDIEANTDMWSCCSGRTQVKIGVNERELCDKHSDVSFMIIDNHHLNEHGVRYLSSKVKNLVIVTTNEDHIALRISGLDNVDILLQEELDLKQALEFIYKEYGCDRLTIQTGGMLNSLFLRSNLIDSLNIVIAPALIGGVNTPTLVDGDSLEDESELSLIKAFILKDCKVLNNSYIQLKYEKR